MELFRAQQSLVNEARVAAACLWDNFLTNKLASVTQMLVLALKSIIETDEGVTVNAQYFKQLLKDELKSAVSR